MSAKLDVRDIVRGYLKTLRDYRTKEPSYWDIFVFLLVPVVASLFLVCFGITGSEGVVGNIMAAASILAGLLLNLLVLVYDLFDKFPKAEQVRDQAEKSRLNARRQTLEEVYSTISYLILVSILVIGFTIALGAFDNVYVRHSLAFVLWALCGNFLLSLLMVLKRVYIMLQAAHGDIPKY